MQDVALICGAGKDPYAVTEEAVKWALKLSGKNLKLRREKEFPEILRNWAGVPGILSVRA